MIKKTKDFYDNDVYQITNDNDGFIPFDEDDIKEIYDLGAKLLFSMETNDGWLCKVMCTSKEQAEQIATDKVNPKLVLQKLLGEKE
jgi:hypothetical protein